MIYTTLQNDVSRVRRLLGAVEDLVPDHVIEEALRIFTPSAVAHYIRLTLAGPREQHAERKATTES